MKQIVVLSGKGGTGKTSVTAGFAHLASQSDQPVRAVLVDADVDASNLELVLRPRQVEQNAFTGGAVAEIDPELCERCGNCAEVCRFEAVLYPGQNGDSAYSIDPIACEGCASCMYQCPADAIRMIPQQAGYWYRSETPFGPLFHALLIPGQENSGKLVTLVKQRARLLALEENYPLQIVDGPPGIGCPVISAISGADLALIVTEPTVSGIHDLERILETTEHFKLASQVCINKADLYPASAAQIEAFCEARSIPVVGRIPFDESVTAAMVSGFPVTQHRPCSPASQAVERIWHAVLASLSL